VGRFAQMAQSQYLRSPDSPRAEDSMECETSSQRVVVYCVEVVSLLRNRAHSKTHTSMSQEKPNGLKNFKKFRKV